MSTVNSGRVSKWGLGGDSERRRAGDDDNRREVDKLSEHVIVFENKHWGVVSTHLAMYFVNTATGNIKRVNTIQCKKEW